MTSTDRYFALPYREQLANPQRRERHEIRMLRRRNVGDDCARAEGLERALDHINRAFADCGGW